MVVRHVYRASVRGVEDWKDTGRGVGGVGVRHGEAAMPAADTREGRAFHGDIRFRHVTPDGPSRSEEP